MNKNILYAGFIIPFFVGNLFSTAPEVISSGTGDEPIWFAPEADVNAIKSLLAETKGVGVDTRNSFGQTGLMYAINTGAFGDFGRYVAGTHTKPGLVETLIAYGADVNAKSDQSPREEDHSFYNTPLHYAVIIVNPRDSVPLIDYLIRQGADVNAQNNLLETPLMWSSQASLAENLQAIFKEMITNLADVNMQNNVGNTYLHLLIRNKDSLGVQYMMEHFGSMFDLNLKSREGMSVGDLKNSSGWTPLEYAKNTLQPESTVAIESFKPLGLDGNILVRDELGRTPLMLAVIRNDYDFAKRQIEVLDAKVNDEDTTKYKNKPIHFAVIRQYNALPFIKLLIENKADSNSQNAFGDTPLHYVVKYDIKSHDRNAIAKFLIENGANPNIPNKKGETALDLARKADVNFASTLERLFNNQQKSKKEKTINKVASGSPAKNVKESLNTSKEIKKEEVATPTQPASATTTGSSTDVHPLVVL